MKGQYPFCQLIIPPTVKPAQAEIRVIAAHKSLINAVRGTKSDFQSEYSKELYLIIPPDYKSRGCVVYGASWLKTEMLTNEDIHFFHDGRGELIQTSHGFQLCVGTPESFKLMRNVILENVRTSDNMLVAYERIMTGESKRLELLAYAHGEEGRIQFQHNKKRYIPEE